MADYQVAAAVIFAAVIYFFYRASVDLDAKKHAYLRLLMFYAALALGWAASNVALAFAVKEVAGDTVISAITIFYEAYTFVGVVIVIYLALRFFSFTFHHALKMVRVMTGRGKRLEDAFDSEGDAW